MPGDTPFGAVEAVHELLEAITATGPVDPFLDDAVRLGESEPDHSLAMPGYGESVCCFAAMTTRTAA
jgi:hypothetical protein